MITTRNWWYVTTRISRWQKSSDDYHICSVDWVSDSVLDMAGCMNHDHWKLTYITTELMKMTMTNLICSMDWRSGLSPPWQQKIFSSTMAATGRLQNICSVSDFLFVVFKTVLFTVAATGRLPFFCLFFSRTFLFRNKVILCQYLSSILAHSYMFLFPHRNRWVRSQTLTLCA